MAPFPLPLSELFGHWGAYVVYLLIGIAFGAVLELSGFGKSSKLAAQFYFQDMTVLKVMFTAIVVAMLLVFFSTAVGLLDFNLVYVNPTYLWPGIVGGLLMGVGFIIGGFCPGTSLVAAATAKIDGMFFVLGVFFGIFLFGETVGAFFEDFWYSSFMGRFTLAQLFNISTGWVVLGVVLMALFMFWGSEKLEQHFGGMDPAAAPRWRYGAAGATVLLGVAVLVIGQPTNADRWNAVSKDREAQLAERGVQIHPAELLDLQADDRLIAMVIDVRSEGDFNRFHLLDAQRIPLDVLPAEVPTLLEQPANTVFVVMGNDEAAATEAWKYLVAESVPNVYILEGGANNWIATFADEAFLAEHPPTLAGDDALRYLFPMALGARYSVAAPHADQFKIDYTPKVQLEQKRGPGAGGCG